MMTRAATVVSFAVLFTAACGGNDAVSSQADAEKAYRGLDLAIDKAIDLGFAGFNAAKSANIDPQTTMGAKSGTLTVSGKVDQGASANKTMTLGIGLVKFSDDGKVTYDTSADAASQPVLGMMLKGIPDGTLTGSLASATGSFTMSGELKGSVALTLSFTGQLQQNAVDASKVERKPGTTHVTGTAVSSAGTYTVDVMR